VNGLSVKTMKTALETVGAVVKIIAPHLGTIATEEGNKLPVDQSYLIAASVLFDAVFVPAGNGIDKLKSMKEVIEFVNDAFKHCKYIAAEGQGNNVLAVTIRTYLKTLLTLWERIVFGKGKISYN
jgi:catalase